MSNSIAMASQELVETALALLAQAERRNSLSPRDGGLLRLVPASERLTALQMRQILQEQLLNSSCMVKVLEGCSKLRGQRPPRHMAAWLRGSIYVAAGNSKQALRDARAALAYAGPAAATATAAAQGVPTQLSQPPRGKPLQQGCTWFPALLLAGEAYAALGEPAQAVVHLAQAQQAAPADAAETVAAALQQAVRGLSPDQGSAWATGGLSALLQQLQDEADCRLPEVLRPRPKWYYFQQWMKQRIHLALLELHLAALMPSKTSNTQQLMPSNTSHSDSTNSSASGGNGSNASGTGSGTGGGRDAHSINSYTETSTSSARGRLLLELLASGTEEAPVVAAAAAAAGFSGTAVHMTGPAVPLLTHSIAASLQAATTEPAPAGAAAADAAVGVAGTTTHITIEPAAAAQQQQQQKGLQLPEPVLSKLLSMDAGDLDLLTSHPVALQGQVYELLDVLQVQGVEGLEAYTITPLSWQEVQALAGPGTVGLPLGYKPTAPLLPPPPAPAMTAQALPAPALPAADVTAITSQAAAITAAAESSPALSAAEAAEAPAAGALTAPVANTPVMSDSVITGAAGGSMVPFDSHKQHQQQQGPGWRRPGWTRVQYVAEAAAAAALSSS